MCLRSGKPIVWEKSLKRAFHHILHIEGRHQGMLKPAVRRRGREAGRASSWARSRPCIVVGADLTMRRPAGLLDLRRRCAAARRGVRGIRGVLRRASGAQFLIAWTWLRAVLHRLDDGAVARPAAGCAAAVDSLAPDIAAASEGVLLRCSAFLHQRAAASGAAFYHLDVFAGNFCRVGLGGAAPVRARGPGARLH